MLTVKRQKIKFKAPFNQGTELITRDLRFAHGRTFASISRHFGVFYIGRHKLHTLL